ncbi:MAG: 2-oxo acid dehydrogenase subunit E2 [Vicinamibacteraceae bacterium]|nr:2-oxo acid dehydrogenase subunit E2 [Vicinamibacteraceae bacterium]
MPTNVVMPQMGESVAEGTLTRWIKKVGDRIDRDEPLFEISTDKVDAEIPSPAAGTLVEIRVKEGETVPVDSIVAVLAAEGEQVETSPSEAEASTAPPSEGAPPVTPATPQADGTPGTTAAAAAAHATAAHATADATATHATADATPSSAAPSVEGQRDELRRTRSSPLVRRIAKEHQVDLAQVPGSGIGGRVTKHDILNHIETRGARPAAGAAPGGAAAGSEAAAAAAPSSSAGPPAAAGPVFRPGEAVEIVPMTVMRKKIAEHMIFSKRTSAHVHSVFEVDLHRVAKIREAKKAEYERLGVKLTYMSFIARAVCEALRAVPVMNSSVDGDNIVYKKDINLGIAVALDWGLIVPVVRHADEKNLLGLGRAIADLASRARSKQLKPDEVQGGTFTITNPGVFGTLFGMPIISQPQVGILGVGAIEKRVVVTDDDTIAIRPRAYFSIGYDHRIVDGAVADEFMSVVKRTLEQFDPGAA